MDPSLCHKESPQPCHHHRGAMIVSPRRGSHATVWMARGSEALLVQLTHAPRACLGLVLVLGAALLSYDGLLHRYSNSTGLSSMPGALFQMVHCSQLLNPQNLYWDALTGPCDLFSLHRHLESTGPACVHSHRDRALACHLPCPLLLGAPLSFQHSLPTATGSSLATGWRDSSSNSILEFAS